VKPFSIGRGKEEDATLMKLIFEIDFEIKISKKQYKNGT